MDYARRVRAEDRALRVASAVAAEDFEERAREIVDSGDAGEWLMGVGATEPPELQAAVRRLDEKRRRYESTARTILHKFRDLNDTELDERIADRPAEVRDVVRRLRAEERVAA